MDVFRAMVLGLVQGLAEPLPISSSGHLILVPWVLGWPSHTLTFDVALHGGTALALIAYFWQDWVVLAGAFFDSLRDLQLGATPERRMVWYVAVACVPGAVAGVLFEQKVEDLLRQPWLVATLLVLMGFILLAADSLSSQRRSLSQLTLVDAVVIGLAQAFALVPGVSRSGVTITAALLLQVSRADAARFSFLLSGPIVAGAFIYKMLGFVRTGFPADEVAPFLSGVAVAAVVGYLAIRFLLDYLQRHTLRLFVYYRFLAGGFVLALLVLRPF